MRGESISSTSLFGRRNRMRPAPQKRCRARATSFCTGLIRTLTTGPFPTLTLTIYRLSKTSSRHKRRITKSGPHIWHVQRTIIPAALPPHLRFSGERNDLASLRVACSPWRLVERTPGVIFVPDARLYHRCENRPPHSKAFFI